MRTWIREAWHGYLSSPTGLLSPAELRPAWGSYLSRGTQSPVEKLSGPQSISRFTALKTSSPHFLNRSQLHSMSAEGSFVSFVSIHKGESQGFLRKEGTHPNKSLQIESSPAVKGTSGHQGRLSFKPWFGMLLLTGCSLPLRSSCPTLHGYDGRVPFLATLASASNTVSSMSPWHRKLTVCPVGTHRAPIQGRQ